MNEYSLQYDSTLQCWEIIDGDKKHVWGVPMFTKKEDGETLLDNLNKAFTRGLRHVTKPGKLTNSMTKKEFWNLVAERFDCDRCFIDGCKGENCGIGLEQCAGKIKAAYKQCKKSDKVKVEEKEESADL